MHIDSQLRLHALDLVGAHAANNVTTLRIDMWRGGESNAARRATWRGSERQWSLSCVPLPRLQELLALPADQMVAREAHLLERGVLLERAHQVDSGAARRLVPLVHRLGATRADRIRRQVDEPQRRIECDSHGQGTHSFSRLSVRTCEEVGAEVELLEAWRLQQRHGDEGGACALQGVVREVETAERTVRPREGGAQSAEARMARRAERIAPQLERLEVRQVVQRLRDGEERCGVRAARRAHGDFVHREGTQLASRGEGRGDRTRARHSKLVATHVERAQRSVLTHQPPHHARGLWPQPRTHEVQFGEVERRVHIHTCHIREVREGRRERQRDLEDLVRHRRRQHRQRRQPAPPAALREHRGGERAAREHLPHRQLLPQRTPLRLVRTRGAGCLRGGGALGEERRGGVLEGRPAVLGAL
mmetsp:Transcript_44172/g.109779  ORF Transcript_44172/g.109779 Transcript_44172/m.109779 type:complete len:419 (+) Transcript_44172:555-1811(+)